MSIVKTTARPLAPMRGRHELGATLIESLIGILIFCIGVVGTLGLMAQMTRAQGAAHWKSQASMLGGELVGVMWADKSIDRLNYTSSGCGSHKRCAEWQAKVARSLPSGLGKVEALGGGAVKVTVEWEIPGEGTHSYEMQTTVTQ